MFSNHALHALDASISRFRNDTIIDFNIDWRWINQLIIVCTYDYEREREKEVNSDEVML